MRRGEGDRAAQRFSLEALAAGRPIGIFPEGTRSRDGHLKAGKPGAALLAMRSGAPLLPVGIAGTHRIFPGRSRWPHRDARSASASASRSRCRIEPDGRLDREALAAGTDRIMGEIAALLPPEQQSHALGWSPSARQRLYR